MRNQFTNFKEYIAITRHRLASVGAPKFLCPICGYHGAFKAFAPNTGLRKHALCPNCGSRERHRLQYLVLERLAKERGFSQARMLHFAPEAFLRGYFKSRVRTYETADLFADNVDHAVDLQDLPFAHASYDFVYASHVLEHVQDDRKALAEIRRILTPGGLAILPVPVVVERTIEYSAPNPHETDHVRAPGADYFDRYRDYFPKVQVIDSSDVEDRYQVYVYEDRSHLPNDLMPHRTAMSGDRHLDFVPVCYAD